MWLDGRRIAGRTLAEQLDLIWSNIAAIMTSADITVASIVRVTSYLRDAAYAQANQDPRTAALRGFLVPTTAAVVQTLTPTGW